MSKIYFGDTIFLMPIFNANPTLARMSRIKRIYFFILFLFAARATVLTTNLDPRSNIVGFLLFCIPTIYMIYKYRLSFKNRNLLILYSILSLWLLIHFLLGKEFRYFDTFLLFLKILAAYSLVNLFKSRLFLLYEDTVTKLSIFCVFLWVITIIIGPLNIAKFGLFEPATRISSASFLIYNVANVFDTETQLYGGITRNCGFCWEPGLFASFIIIALVINLFIYKRIKKNKNFFYLSIALFTSVSTTGYIAYIVIIISYLYAKSQNKIFFLLKLFVLVPVLYLLYSLPFISEKIEENSQKQSFLTEDTRRMDYVDNSETVITPQRFECIYLDYLNFIHSPIIGYGLNTTYVSENISENLSLTNGILKDFAKYGIIIAILLQLLLIKNSRYFSLSCNANQPFLLYVVLAILSFSYYFMELPLIASIFLYRYFLNEK